MTATFDHEPYEGIAVAIAMIDAAIEAMSDHACATDWEDQLTEIRNEMNEERIALLGNGAERPWHVSDLKLPTA